MRSRVLVGTGTARTAFSKLLGIAGNFVSGLVGLGLLAIGLAAGRLGFVADGSLDFILVIIPIIWFNYQNEHQLQNSRKDGLLQTKRRG
jgi:hypothetical protein